MRKDINKKLADLESDLNRRADRSAGRAGRRGIFQAWFEAIAAFFTLQVAYHEAVEAVHRENAATVAGIHVDLKAKPSRESVRAKLAETAKTA